MAETRLKPIWLHQYGFYPFLEQRSSENRISGFQTTFAVLYALNFRPRSISCLAGKGERSMRRG